MPRRPALRPKKYDETTILDDPGKGVFRCVQERHWYEHFFSSTRPIHIERFVDWDTLPGEVTALFDRRGWCSFLAPTSTNVFDTAIRQFYATLVRKSSTLHEAYLDGIIIPFSAAIIARKMRAKGVILPVPFQYPNNGAPHSKDECVARMAPGAEWTRETFPIGGLAATVRFTHIIVCGAIHQTTNDSVVRSRHANFLYYFLDPESTINLAQVFYADILNAAYDETGKAALPYARFITELLMDAGVDEPGAQTRLPRPVSGTSTTRSERQMRVAHPNRPIHEEDVPEEAPEDPMMDVDEEEFEDEEEDSDFEPPGANFDRRLSAVESRLDGFINQYNQDQAAYRRDTRMMYQLQVHLHQLNFGGPPPPFYYDPYDPNAPSSSHPPPP